VWLKQHRLSLEEVVLCRGAMAHQVNKKKAWIGYRGGRFKSALISAKKDSGLEIRGEKREQIGCGLVGGKKIIAK